MTTLVLTNAQGVEHLVPYLYEAHEKSIKYAQRQISKISENFIARISRGRLLVKLAKQRNCVYIVKGGSLVAFQVYLSMAEEH